MMTPSMSVVASVLGAALLLESPPASAAENPGIQHTSEQPAHLNDDEIVVTASVQPTLRRDISTAVSILTADEITHVSARTTAEVFRQIPGIRAEASGVDGNANIAVRGLPVASGGAKFLQLQEDGMPVMQFGDIAFGNADIFLRLDDTISSIQAVRGGLASTLASNAPGGVINLISRDGSSPGGSIAATVGLDYREARIDFNYGGKLTDRTRFNIGGFRRKGEGSREVGYNGDNGYQIKANLTHEFDRGHLRLFFKRLDDKAIAYMPMPAQVTGSNSAPRFASLPGFDLGADTLHSALFTTDVGLDGDNKLHTTDIRDGMHPVVTSIGAEFVFEIADGLKLEERLRHNAVHGRFVAPFPAQVASSDELANSIGQALTGTAAGMRLVYASGQRAGQVVPANALAMRVHLFNTSINDLGSFTNDIRMTRQADRWTVTAGLYSARQSIDMDWTWNSYLFEVDRRDGAPLDVVDPNGTVLTRSGLYAYGVPYWGNCCQRSYDVRYSIRAPYLAAMMEVGKLGVDASLRYDHVKAHGSYAGTLQQARDVDDDGVVQPVEGSVSLIDNAAARPVDYSVAYWSWAIGAIYRINDQARIFGRASRGGRANADRLLFGRVDADGSVKRANAVDFVDQLEAGLKYHSRALTLSLTAFRTKTQEQNFEVTSGRFLERTYKAIGLEMDAALHSGMFGLDMCLTWTDAKIARDAITPANAENRPRRQAKLTYQITPTFDLDFATAGLGIFGTTRAYAQDNNQLVLPAYSQVNAFVTFQMTEKAEISINANNVFDSVGFTEAEEGAIVDNTVNYVRARSIAGRTVSASLRYAF